MRGDIRKMGVISSANAPTNVGFCKNNRHMIAKPVLYPLNSTYNLPIPARGGNILNPTTE